MGENGWTAVPVKPETREELGRLRAPSRLTYDEVLRALVALWKRTNGDRTIVLDDIPPATQKDPSPAAVGA